mgnify:CR=1 FL=1
MGILLISTIKIIQKGVQDHPDKFGVHAISLKPFLAPATFLVLFSSLRLQTYAVLVILVLAFVRHLKVQVGCVTQVNLLLQFLLIFSLLYPFHVLNHLFLFLLLVQRDFLLQVRFIRY